MNTPQFKFTNRLIDETSPYLLSHSHNPVDWRGWNQSSLNEAKTQNKLMIISIGYAACHWCHVMERESFEDEEVARIMNTGYISIKVDREERPDIDQIYMNAAMLINHSGGWPLNAITLPDGRPVYAGTYFPREKWIKLLAQISDIWENEPEKLIEQAESITEGINKSELIYLNDKKVDFCFGEAKRIAEGILRNVDFELGGTNGQPKFPLPVGYRFLLEYYYYSGDKRALEAVQITLNQMALGGMYDQIGGGFARYSVDKFWHVPHFEKMLYDNAQLVSLYSKAYQLTKNQFYKSVVYETLAFVERELTSPEGGFYSTLDADSEGVEGKYYIWDIREIETVLGKYSDIAIKYFNITKNGNWENSNILHPSYTPSEFAEKISTDKTEFINILSSIKSQMLSARLKRIHPPLDDKILTSWNALMLKGYIDAYRVFDDDSFLKRALINAEFLNKNLIKKGCRLDRNFKNNKSNINAYLDDYATLIDAFIELYQATFDEKWIFTADKLLTYTIEHFLDKSNGMYFYTSDLDPSLIARKMDVNDNVIPGSNSVMAHNLFRIGKFFGRQKLIDASLQMLKNVFPLLAEGNFYYANWSRLLLSFINKPFEIIIMGNDFQKLRKAVDTKFLPNILLGGGNKEGNLELTHNRFIKEKTFYYLCQNNKCHLPSENFVDLIKQIEKEKVNFA